MQQKIEFDLIHWGAYISYNIQHVPMSIIWFAKIIIFIQFQRMNKQQQKCSWQLWCYSVYSIVNSMDIISKNEFSLVTRKQLLLSNWFKCHVEFGNEWILSKFNSEAFHVGFYWSFFGLHADCRHRYSLTAFHSWIYGFTFLLHQRAIIRF